MKLAVERFLSTHGVALLVAGGIMPGAAFALSEFVRDGEAGFVVTHIEYALSRDAEETGACPLGMNQSYQDPREVYANLPPIQKKEGEGFEELEDRVEAIAESDPDVKSHCLHPELASPTTNYRSVSGGDIPVFGIDMDGRDSTLAQPAAPGTCPHEDFQGMDGKTGVDNQYFRVMGCNPGYQSTGLGNTFNTAMLTGAWGMLIKLGGVDDIHNDDDVEVSIYANGDPIRLSPSREPLPYATYTVHRESRFYAGTTRGRIVDGVLLTEPVDVRIPYDVNAMFVDRALLDAQLHVTLSDVADNGSLEGYLAGYAPIEEQYDLEIGFRDAKVGTDENSEPSPFRRKMAAGIGKAGAMGYTCEGVYHALYEHADGHPDPETGKCTSISTQYRIEAIPAFVVEKGAAEDRKE